ncbi:hypothetical protein XELAEV_18014112mg [Xenopus laevis]|uniref:Uncharacterized protein n=1 Tax=Xenopus laevis TaxID=8355 RepID=A0A974DQR8_XENLA|nr:hypothetical protein XELAEV_18014112mg [Xenopus laevis]
MQWTCRTCIAVTLSMDPHNILILKINNFLHTGTAPNITRNAIVNCTELVTYDLIKDSILKANIMTDNLPCHFTSAFGAGFCTTVIASPVDVVKTRYMNSAKGQYTSALNCALTMFRKEGPRAFYKG